MAPQVASIMSARIARTWYLFLFVLCKGSSQITKQHKPNNTKGPSKIVTDFIDMYIYIIHMCIKLATPEDPHFRHAKHLISHLHSEYSIRLKIFENGGARSILIHMRPPCQKSSSTHASKTRDCIGGMHSLRAHAVQQVLFLLVRAANRDHVGPLFQRKETRQTKTKKSRAKTKTENNNKNNKQQQRPTKQNGHASSSAVHLQKSYTAGRRML